IILVMIKPSRVPRISMTDKPSIGLPFTRDGARRRAKLLNDAVANAQVIEGPWIRSIEGDFVKRSWMERDVRELGAKSQPSLHGQGSDTDQKAQRRADVGPATLADTLCDGSRNSWIIARTPPSGRDMAGRRSQGRRSGLSTRDSDNAS